MKKILVDGREFGLESFAQVFEDFIVSAHGRILDGGGWSCKWALGISK
jgi:hypothetical protein